LALTRSTAAERTRPAIEPRERQPWPAKTLLWLVACALLLGWGFHIILEVKSRSFVETEKELAAEQVLNLNELSSRDDLLPLLTMFSSPKARAEAARRIYYLSGTASNVGAVARLHLLTTEQFRALKPRLIVRRPAQFRRDLLLWAGIFLVSFLAAGLWFAARGFRGDHALLIPLFLLTGAGFLLMVSLRDPLRDNMIFIGFAQGAVGGCVVLALLSFLDMKRAFGGLSYVPLMASFLLSLALILFGSGPGASDVKVNLFGFQPVEIIRILLVLFLAGYFAQRWDVLRHARETRPRLAWLARYISMPPLEFVAPVLVCVALSLVFFFLQRDLGPALIFTCLFLALYAVARSRALLAVAGLLLLILGFAAGHTLGFPHTVSERVSMWLHPWNNLVHGGDQLAQSLWAFATGGAAGTGPGLGDPALVPAAHTDLVLSAVGEEWGFLGVAAVLGLYAFLVYRAFRIALRAASDYEFFLAAGIGAATALQVLLIAGGALGVLPLSGVVTPFLSYGRTALVANFALFGILLSISRGPRDPERNRAFQPPVKALGVALGTLAVAIVGKAAYVQLVRSAPVMGEGTLVTQADGQRRYEYNPRFQEIMREIPKGSIYDRNGLPLATSRWDELQAHRADYARMGIDIDRACPRNDARYYPFGSVMFDLLGDVRTRENWGASNTSFVERDYATHLRGYDDRATLVEVKNPKTGRNERLVRYDYRELVPLLRHRYEPDSPEVRRVLDRPLDVRMSVDARLQLRLAGILRQKLQQAGRDKGAVVVLEPATGDLLASVSYPLPSGDAHDNHLDRARYGLYPPGSTFKVVTTMAALRKDPALAQQKYSCIRLPDGRVGNYIRGSSRPIRDDVRDTAPHGTLDLERALIVSCNAYFAQLGTYNVGAQELFETANLLGIATASPDKPAQLKKSLPQSSYGQGQVVASPFQMARVAATIANGGTIQIGRWVTGESNDRAVEPKQVLTPEAAATVGRFMREVITTGTGRAAGAAVAPIAGKTGTAELASAPSHAWFIGFTPYGGEGKKVAFSILIENGQYGGTYPAAAAVEIVAAARDLGYLGGTAAEATK
jgi:cell division protein FtsW (lipid II flippase)/cell division protein FtsI/penicillin-binding protein 2